MKLYLISQKENDGYDTFDSAVVCADDKKEAQKIRPAEYGWCDYKFVKVKLIGEARKGIKRGVVLASFNAG